MLFEIDVENVYTLVFTVNNLLIGECDFEDFVSVGVY